MLAGTGAGVAHCPSQNIAARISDRPIPEMRRAGVPVGIGVDGAGSNDGGSILTEMRLATLAHRLMGTHDDYGPDDWMTPHDVPVDGNAPRAPASSVARTSAGSRRGAAADLVMIDLGRLCYAGGLHDPLACILFVGDTGQVDTTVVAGRIRVRGGRLVGCRRGQASPPRQIGRPHASSPGPGRGRDAISEAWPTGWSRRRTGQRDEREQPAPHRAAGLRDARGVKRGRHRRPRISRSSGSRRASIASASWRTARCGWRAARWSHCSAQGGCGKSTLLNIVAGFETPGRRGRDDPGTTASRATRPTGAPRRWYSRTTPCSRT